MISQYKVQQHGQYLIQGIMNLIISPKPLLITTRLSRIPSTSTARPNFLSLPGQIRLLIYDQLLV